MNDRQKLIDQDEFNNGAIRGLMEVLLGVICTICEDFDIPRERFAKVLAPIIVVQQVDCGETPQFLAARARVTANFIEWLSAPVPQDGAAANNANSSQSRIFTIIKGGVQD